MILIDEDLLRDSRYQGTYRLHSAYRNVRNYISDNQSLVSLVNNRVSMGPARIRLDGDMALTDNVPEDLPSITGHIVSFPLIKGPLRLWECTLPAMDRKNVSGMKETLERVLREEKPVIFDLSSRIDGMMIDMIDETLEKTGAEELGALIGFGPGLTPLGDDVLMGYMFGKNLFDPDSAFNQAVYEAAEKRTTRVSSEFLYQMAKGRYSDDLRMAAEELSGTRPDTGALQRVLRYGHSSGWGILRGFYGYLQQLSGKENTWRSTQKY
ncbi:MAG: DUF2877 domain-containing protein [Erysipelotrichales bacterium]|nr:DUF2877 domain-containing protein [Erysipelotrichales bacterium]